MLVERSMHPEWLSNAYAVADRQGGTAVFVDSGADVAPLVAAVEGWGATPAAILRTHSHHDHVVHEDDLRDRYGIPVIHTIEALPASIGDLRLHAIFTPGHADDHLAFVFDNEAVFTGDVLFKDAVGGGDLAQVRASVLELLELPGVLRRLPRSHRRDDDRPGARVEPVRPRLARDGAGGDGAGARRRPRRDARRLVAGLRRQGQGLGPLRRRHRRHRRRLSRRAVILAIDQGTSGTTCLVVDGELEIRGRGYVAIASRYPQPGWVEQDPEEIWSSVLAAAEAALASAGLRAADLTAIGITNQRETTILWERGSGRPLQDAIVWQDRRTAERCRELPADLIRERTGLVPDPYFSATKLEWLLARAEQPAAELAFGTVDSWLVWKLTGGRRHVTDVTNAARTMLFDIGRLAWDDELLALFGVDPSLLPEVVATSGVLGEGELFGAALPIASLVGDQQAALFGQGCFEPREAKATYGTGSFVLVNVGGDRGAAPAGLLKTVAAVAPGHDVQYAVEGSVLTSGAVVQWLRDGLGIAADADEVERLAVEAGSSGGVIVRPRARRARVAVLGSRRPRPHQRDHRRHDARAHRARDARGHRAPGGRRARGASRRRRVPPRRRRSEPQRVPDAAPGGPAGTARRGRGREGEHRRRRRRPRGARHGRLAEPGGVRGAGAARPELRALAVPRRGGASGAPSGGSRSSVRGCARSVW